MRKTAAGIWRLPNDVIVRATASNKIIISLNPAGKLITDITVATNMHKFGITRWQNAILLPRAQSASLMVLGNRSLLIVSRSTTTSSTKYTVQLAVELSPWMLKSLSTLYSTEGQSSMIVTIGPHNDIVGHNRSQMGWITASGHRIAPTPSIITDKFSMCIASCLAYMSKIDITTLKKDMSKISPFQLRDLKAPLVRKNNW